MLKWLGQQNPSYVFLYVKKYKYLFSIKILFFFLSRNRRQKFLARYESKMGTKMVEDVLQNVVELWCFGMSCAGSQYMDRSEGLVKCL